MKIEKGDVFWIPVNDENMERRAITHPHVVLQDTIINNSRIDSVVVCGISTNMKKAYERGNVLLEIGEANLPKRSIVVVSQISVVKKDDIEDYIGKICEEKLDDIFSGMKLIQSM